MNSTSVLYVIAAKLESASDNNLVEKYINVQIYIVQAKCMTLLMLPTSPDITTSHLNADFDLNGKSIQNLYVFTLFEIVHHLEGGQGENCDHYMARYCHVLTFGFC